MEVNAKLSDLFKEFIREQEYVKCLRPATILGHRNTYSAFEKILKEVKNASEITTGMITRDSMVGFFERLETRTRIVGKNTEKKGVKPSTVATYRRRLSIFFEWLRIKGHIDVDPFEGIRRIKLDYVDQKYLKKDDVGRILNAIISHTEYRNSIAQKRDLLMFDLLLYCGLRKSELRLLEVRDVNVGKRELTVRGETSKSDRTHFIPLGMHTMDHFKDYMKERTSCGKYKTPFLFVSSKKDNGLSDNGMKHWVNWLRKVSGIRFHLHQFRHTFAMNFLNTCRENNNIVKLMQLMGHRDIRMTQRYLRALPTDHMRPDVDRMGIDSLLDK